MTKHASLVTTGSVPPVGFKFNYFLMVNTRSVAHPGGCACIPICVVKLNMDSGHPVVTRVKM